MFIASHAHYVSDKPMEDLDLPYQNLRCSAFLWYGKAELLAPAWCGSQWPQVSKSQLQRNSALFGGDPRLRSMVCNSINCTVSSFDILMTPKSLVL